jgi:TRAP-type mannitol/chloroaromatic compound transport system permease small subunit
MLRLGFFDRLACAALGAFFGVVYGAMLAVGIGYATDGHIRVDIIWRTTEVFAVLGFLLGPIVGDLIGNLIHFVWGLFFGIVSGASVFFGGSGDIGDQTPRTSGLIRTLFVVGLGTGLSLMLALRVS